MPFFPVIFLELFRLELCRVAWTAFLTSTSLSLTHGALSLFSLTHDKTDPDREPSIPTLFVEIFDLFLRRKKDLTSIFHISPPLALSFPCFSFNASISKMGDLTTSQRKKRALKESDASRTKIREKFPQPRSGPKDLFLVPTYISQDKCRKSIPSFPLKYIEVDFLSLN